MCVSHMNASCHTGGLLKPLHKHTHTHTTHTHTHTHTHTNTHTHTHTLKYMRTNTKIHADTLSFFYKHTHECPQQTKKISYVVFLFTIFFPNENERGLFPNQKYRGQFYGSHFPKKHRAFSADR